MKTLKQYLLEYSTPDLVKHGNDSFDYTAPFAVPFIYNAKTNYIMFGDDGGITHIDMLELSEESGEDWTELLSLYGTEFEDLNCADFVRLRLNADTKNKYPDHVIFGRIWDLSNVKGSMYEINDRVDYEYYTQDEIDAVKDKNELVIAYWNEIEQTTFKKITNKLVDDFCKFNKLNKNDYTIYVVDNNNEVINFTENVVINKRTETNKKLLNSLQRIHLATQEEKKTFFKEFVRNRNSYNQRTKYNKTKSRTEAEWRSQMYQENKNK